MFKNWKTTLMGFLLAVAHVSVNGLGWKQLVQAALMAGLGALAKDHNVQDVENRLVAGFGGMGQKVGPVLILMFLFGSAALAQAPPLPDAPVSHVTVSASFNGYDSNGKYVPATVDTVSIGIYRNQAATQGFNVAYEHISVPSLGQRWELGLGCYYRTLPRVKNLLFDLSNFVATACAGAGKLLSTSDGNLFAWTVAPAITYPIAGHMAWTASYNYLHAKGGITALVNKSYSQVGTGPLLYF